MLFRTLCVLCILCGSLAFAQNYRCDWSVVGLGGGSMSSASYQAGTTIGQTAAGQMIGTAYQAFIGFWQIDTVSTGILEEANWNAIEPLTTMLYAPFPNPGRGATQVSYSLATETHVLLQLFDLAGRVIRTLADRTQPVGNYSLLLTPYSLANGVYLLKLRTPDYQATRKLIVQ